MPIETHSILGRLQADVDKYSNRVKKGTRRVEELREEYRTVHWSRQRKIAGKGFLAKRALERAEANLRAAEEALAAEERRLLQPDSFLRFG